MAPDSVHAIPSIALSNLTIIILILHVHTIILLRLCIVVGILLLHFLAGTLTSRSTALLRSWGSQIVGKETCSDNLGLHVLDQL